MSQEDYNTIMSVVSENLAETADDTATTPAVSSGVSAAPAESKTTKTGIYCLTFQCI